MRQDDDPRYDDLADRLHGAWEGAAQPWLLGIVGALAALLSAALVGAWFTCGYQECPDPQALSAWEPGDAPVVVDRDGNEFATLLPVQRVIVNIDSLPPHVGNAFVAVEDRRFRSHPGVDVRRVVGAVVANVKSRRLAQGGSTITMQLARNAFPEHLPASERSFRRKIAETRVALQIEDAFDKDEILGLYLNQIYFGNGATGIAAAARHYFGKAARDLTVAESALLAAMVKAPAYYDPREDTEDALERRNLVLDLMLEHGFLEPKRHAEARRGEIEVLPAGRAQHWGENLPAPWYLAVVRRELDRALGRDVTRGRIRVVTALDRGLQEAAEEALIERLAAIEEGAFGSYSGGSYDPAAPPSPDGSPYLQGAIVVLDARTGGVQAYVGGRNYVHSQFDRVANAFRQAGSAFKPFVYGAALEQGYPPSHLLDDSPIALRRKGSPTYRPTNYDGAFEGRVTAREALRRSRNVPAVQLGQEIGTKTVIDFARTAGLTGEIPDGPSTVLGTVAVSPLQLASAYTTFAGVGRSVEPRFIERIESDNGRVLWRPQRTRERRMDRGVAYLINDMLADAVDRGTGHAVRTMGFRGPVAGKTGTTQNAHDVWFVGYTRESVGVVWMGFDQPQAILPRATGGALAAPVWGRMMTRAGKQGAGWQRPRSVREQPVSRCPGAETDLFLWNMSPSTRCDWSQLDSIGRRMWVERLLYSSKAERDSLRRLYGLGRAPDRFPDRPSPSWDRSRDADAPARESRTWIREWRTDRSRPRANTAPSDTIYIPPVDLDLIDTSHTLPIDTPRILRVDSIRPDSARADTTGVGRGGA